MPKQTFFNLNQNKKDKIIKVSFEEFSRLPFEDVSINVIVKEANISRGSFYQYFEDKSDLYSYTFTEKIKDKIDRMSEYVKMNNGDIFDGYHQFFKDELILIKNDESKSFFKNHMLSTKHSLMENIRKARENDELMYEVTNLNKYNIENISDFKLLVMLLGSSIEKCIYHIFVEGWSDEEAINNHLKMLSLIKKGVEKNG
jgi:AcrR family transcriptional regulator